MFEIGHVLQKKTCLSNHTNHYKMHVQKKTTVQFKKRTVKIHAYSLYEIFDYSKNYYLEREFE